MGKSCLLFKAMWTMSLIFRCFKWIPSFCSVYLLVCYLDPATVPLGLSEWGIEINSCQPRKEGNSFHLATHLCPEAPAWGLENDPPPPSLLPFSLGVPLSRLAAAASPPSTALGRKRGRAGGRGLLLWCLVTPGQLKRLTQAQGCQATLGIWRVPWNPAEQSAAAKCPEIA